MGIVDAFVYAHNHHRRNVDNPRNFRDCMEGRIRFMTAITPPFAPCVSNDLPGKTPHCGNFAYLQPKVRYPHLPNSRTTTRERGKYFQGWAICTDGGSRSADGGTIAGWSVVGCSLHGRVSIMFGPVITTETHFACAVSRIHSNNMAELSSVVEALSFLGPVALLPVAHARVSFVIPSTLPVFAWAQSNHGPTPNSVSLVSVCCCEHS